MKANNKKLSHSNDVHRNVDAINSSKKTKASIMKMTALLTLLTLAATNADAQKKQPASKRTVVKRGEVTQLKDSVVSPIKTSKTTTVVLDTSNNPLAVYGYPFTLKIFDANDLTFSESDLEELKHFIEVDLQDKSKRRQIAVNFLRGDRESRKELFLKKIENIFWYNFLKLEDDDTLNINNKAYELYNTYYLPLVKNNAIGWKNSDLTKDQLISSVENNFNAEVVSNNIMYIKNPNIDKDKRMAKVDEFFDVLWKYYNRRKYTSEAADPKAPIKNQDERDAIEFAKLLVDNKVLSTSITEDKTAWFNLEDKTIDANIHILDGIIEKKDIDWVSQILGKILASNKSQQFTIKYRLFKLIRNIATDLAADSTKEEKMKLIYAFSKRVEYATDLNDITLGTKTAKDSAKQVFNDQYANEIYGDLDSKEMRELENLIQDFDKTGQPFDLEGNDLDGMTQAEIDGMILDAIDKDNTLYEMYRYMGHLTKVKVINEKNKSIIEHFSRKDKKGNYIYTSDKAHFNSLVYVTPELFMRLIDNLNANANIKEVRFNLNLMKQAYSPENFTRVVESMWNLKKHIILDTEGELDNSNTVNYKDSVNNYGLNALAKFVTHRQQFAKGYAVTYNANRLSEAEANQLFGIPGPLHLPRCKAFPWNSNEAFEAAITKWKSLNPGGALDMWFLSLGKNAYRSLAKVFNNDQYTIINLDGIESLQKEEQEWINKINATVTTNALSYTKMGTEWKYTFNFGRPPQTDWFFTNEQVNKKKQKYDRYNNRGIAWYNNVTEEDMEYALQNYYGVWLELGEWNTEEYHLNAYNKMQNLVDLRLHTSTWDKSKTDILAKGKVKSLTLYNFLESDEETLKSLVRIMGNLTLPEFNSIPQSDYNEDTKISKNTQLESLFSGTGNINLPNIKQIDMWWAVELHKKKWGLVSLEGDGEWHEWVQSILLYDLKGNEIIVNADNAHEHKELLVPFFNEIYKSKANVKFNSRLERLYNNYISLKKKR